MSHRLFRVIIMIALCFSGLVYAQDKPEVDTLKTSAGDLEMTFLGHGSLMFKFDGKVIHIDPYSRVADYTALPKADLILITHDHGDHLDSKALEQVRQESTEVIIAEVCKGKVDGGTVMTNGAMQTVQGIGIEALPAYNLVNKNGDNPFHPKGAGNGYVLTFGDARVYVAGDTENTPEMKALKEIKVAFLPMNLPYTMTPEMVADAAKAFKPAILYPYHYGNTDTKSLVELLKDETDIEVRIRNMP